MDPSESLVRRESEGEANSTGIGTSSLASLQMDSHVIEDFLLVLNQGRSQELVAHEIGLRVEQCPVGRSHEDAKVVQASQSLPSIGYSNEGSRFRSARGEPRHGSEGVRGLEVKLNGAS